VLAAKQIIKAALSFFFINPDILFSSINPQSFG